MRYREFATRWSLFNNKALSEFLTISRFCDVSTCPELRYGGRTKIFYVHKALSKTAESLYKHAYKCNDRFWSLLYAFALYVRISSESSLTKRRDVNMFAQPVGHYGSLSPSIREARLPISSTRDFPTGSHEESDLARPDRTGNLPDGFRVATAAVGPRARARAT